MGDESIVRHEGSAASALAKPKVISAAPLEVAVDEPTELLAYWRILRKRRWAILTTFFVVFTGVLIATLKQTPIYRATVLLEVEKENPDILTVQQLFEIEAVSDAYLESQYKILESESLARRVIGRLRLDKLEEFAPAKPWWSFGAVTPKPPQKGFVVSGTGAEPSSDTYQDLLPHYYERMSIEPVRRSRLVRINFESKDPELAARAANTLASDYIERSLEVRWEVAQRTSEWLSQQLLGLKGKLEKSENDLQKYARENGLLFLETEKGKSENIVNERFRQLQEGLTQAQTARYEKESLNQLVQAGDYGSIPGVFEDKLIQDLTARLAALRQEHAHLRTTFSDEYPRVKEIQNQINEIDAVLARERARAAQRIARDYQAAVQREKLLA
ncbi:MAG: GumC family protein, partial [Acidobacteriales bacterium]|nr:GumC family protein [Terriglobales bacterium]